jgi:hypothetical protein
MVRYHPCFGRCCKAGTFLACAWLLDVSVVQLATCCGAHEQHTRSTLLPSSRLETRALGKPDDHIVRICEHLGALREQVGQITESMGRRC